MVIRASGKGGVCVCDGIYVYTIWDLSGTAAALWNVTRNTGRIPLGRSGIET